MAEDKGREGSLPQSEVAKALVFRQVLEAIEKAHQKDMLGIDWHEQEGFYCIPTDKEGGQKGRHCHWSSG